MQKNTSPVFMQKSHDLYMSSQVHVAALIEDLFSVETQFTSWPTLHPCKAST